MTAIVTQGHADKLYLPDDSVDLIVTSPPYFNLRSYKDNGEHYDGQIGSEPSVAAYIDRLIECSAEWLRVLKPTGSLFVNLGDSFIKRSLANVPARYAIRMTDELGLYQRADIVWSKPNGFIDGKAPDRVRRTHESFAHFAPTASYFADVDAIRDVPTSNYQDRPQYRRAMELFEGAGFGPEHLAAVRAVGIIDSNGGAVRSGGSWESASGQLAAEVHAVLRSYYRELCGSSAEPKGKVPGSVWEVSAYAFKPPASLGIGHFAAYPPALVRRLILGWCPSGGVVLDPFGGSGTTALVASVHDRVGISVDLSADYCRLAQWRTSDPTQRQRAAKPNAKELAE